MLFWCVVLQMCMRSPLSGLQTFVSCLKRPLGLLLSANSRDSGENSFMCRPLLVAYVIDTIFFYVLGQILQSV